MFALFQIILARYFTCEEEFLGNTIMHKVVLVLVLLVLPIVAHANPYPPQATIFLQTGNGDEHPIGTVKFAPIDENKTSISVSLDSDDFKEHFLSMRPFRCLEGGSEWFCYLQYPYELRNEIIDSDLSDLEYQLLFILKKTSQHGIDAWNGLYYKLTQQADGVITGNLYEGDLNVLQSPPANSYDKPIDLSEFIEANEKRLFPTLIIR